MREQLLQLLAIPMTLPAACGQLGISQEDAVALLTVADLEQAQGRGEAGLIAVVVQAAQRGDWRAAVALLERLYPERWARRPHAVIHLDEAVVHLRRLLVRRTMRLIEATAEPSPAGTEDAAGVPER